MHVTGNSGADIEGKEVLNWKGEKLVGVGTYCFAGFDANLHEGAEHFTVEAYAERQIFASGNVDARDGNLRHLIAHVALQLRYL